jgi:hypothetical protein
MVQGWRWILRNHRGRNQRSPEWFKILAMRKIAVTTPNVLARLRRFDRESAKPYNFVMSPLLVFEGPTLVTAFCDDPSRWAGLEDGPDYVSVEDGKQFRLCKPDEDELLIWTPELVVGRNSKKRPKYVLSTQLRDLEQVFRDYVQHPESKSLAPDGSMCVSKYPRLPASASRSRNDAFSSYWERSRPRCSGGLRRVLRCQTIGNTRRKARNRVEARP